MVLVLRRWHTNLRPIAGGTAGKTREAREVAEIVGARSKKKTEMRAISCTVGKVAKREKRNLRSRKAKSLGTE